ncbi:toxin co-regulated pilus biosynthesis Q family protein [Roseateles sp. UC29_93]|uniref:toxin co-regulated pilus biosynthesis Q family protein n=1 Tax=Roseateles sp. UC29_93 TaxID=3350177 RepID=UPI003670FA64
MVSSRFLCVCALMSGAAVSASPLPPDTGPRPVAAARADLETDAAMGWTFARVDGTVHQALQRWTREAGWQLVWEVDRDFPIDAEVTLRGNFLDALAQAMAVLRDTDFPLQARVQAGTRVVRVVRYLPDGARQ